MKKYLLPSALILLLGLGGALAQNINKSVQLSQDPSGPIGFDSNLGVYFPGHILSSGTNRPVPTVTTNGTGAPTIAGTDNAGTVTMGTSQTAATVTFGQPFLTLPSCTVTWPAVLASEVYTVSTANIAITQTATSGNKINYICLSVN